MKILHLTPTYFSKKSITGGAERYVDELARAMSNHSQVTQVTVVSFGKEAEEFYSEKVHYIVKTPLFYIGNSLLNPFSFKFLKEFLKADVIHVHQLYTVLTELVIIFSLIFKKKIFITDHGGGGRTFLTRFKISRWAKGILSVSLYSARKLKEFNKYCIPLYGGVRRDDILIQHAKSDQLKKKIISIGRVLPHKGFHHLIQAITNEELVIVGSIHDSSYMNYLQKISLGKKVFFRSDLTDLQLKAEIGSSDLAIFASTNIGINGEVLNGEPELLGLAPLECMSQGVPTMVSNIGAYPEIVAEKENLVFVHGDINDLKQKMHNFFQETHELFVFDEKFTWECAAEIAIKNYRSIL
jgi:glycosyltransferase involved in cell wall biosynthesis